MAELRSPGLFDNHPDLAVVAVVAVGLGGPDQVQRRAAPVLGLCSCHKFCE